MKKKIMIIGANGLLGHQLTLALPNDTYDISIIVKNDKKLFDQNNIKHIIFDLKNYKELDQIIKDTSPEIVVNCSAFIAVDQAETDQLACDLINNKLVEHLAHLAEKNGFHLIHYSTDYVFNGDAGPYNEEANTHPLSIYGHSKLSGELAIERNCDTYSILRVVVLYGFHHDRTKMNFITWLIDRLQNTHNVSIVSDQIGTYTYVNDAVQATLSCIDRSAYGLYHISGTEVLSRYELALLIAETFQFNKELIQKVKTDDLNQLAERPMKSGFIIDKAIKELDFKPTSIKDSLVEIQQALA